HLGYNCWRGIAASMGLCSEPAPAPTPERRTVPMAKEPLLTGEEIAAALSGLPGWLLEEGKLTRKYLLASFPDAIAFVNKVASIAERMNHHPFISIDYRRVT